MKYVSAQQKSQNRPSGTLKNEAFCSQIRCAFEALVENVLSNRRAKLLTASKENVFIQQNKARSHKKVNDMETDREAQNIG